MPIKFFPPLSGNINWGEINGNVADQTDLKSDLDGKSDVTHNHDGTYESADPNIQSHLVSSANPHAVAKSQVGLTNVTDDAQLKRAANDFATFTEKAAPVSTDIVLIEDSADAGNKKKVQVGNISSGLPAAALGELLYFNGTDWVAATKLLYYYGILESRQEIVINGGYIGNGSYCFEIIGDNNVTGLVSSGNKNAALLRTYDYNTGEIGLKVMVGNGADTETDVWFVKFIRASTGVEVFKVDFEGKIFADYMKTTDPHPGAYKALYIDTATGKIYSQNAAAGSPSWGLITGTLSNQADLLAALDAKAAMANWALPTGGYEFDGIGDDINLGNDANFNLGTGNFSYEFIINANSTGGQQAIFSKYQSSTIQIKSVINADDTITLEVTNSGTVINVSSASIVTGKVNHILFSVDRGNTAKIYLNGKDDTSGTPTNLSSDVDNTGTALLGALNLGSRYDGSLHLFRHWNRALTDAEALACYNNGLTIRTGLKIADRWGSQTTQTSGTLEAGQRYVIATFVVGDDFTNVGAVANTAGVEFIATGTTPAAWINSSVLKPIGVVVDYRPENAGGYTWKDNSSNRLHGMVNGTSALNESEHSFAFKAKITGDTTLIDIVPPGYRIESILIEETAGKAVTGGINIGTTISGSEVVSAEAVNANADVLASLSGTFFSTSAVQTLYISASTSWNSASVNVSIVMEKVI